MANRLKNVMNPTELDDQIRVISAPAHTHGLSTDFAHSALFIYQAGGHMDAPVEKALIASRLLTESGNVSLNGRALLDLCEERGSVPYYWARSQASIAQKAAQKASQPVPVAA